MHPDRPRRVVVGVDGTPRTVTALRWAATEALRRDAELHAVLAWGDTPRPASYAPVSASSDPAECARRAQDTLSGTVREAFGGSPPVPVHEVVDDRAPVPALLDHARGADLLVLATRSASPAAGPGSVAISCLRQPPCPVVVLPAGTGPSLDGRSAGVTAGVS
jgi:nucleotide-binding universal stress UspA family protein